MDDGTILNIHFLQKCINIVSIRRFDGKFCFVFEIILQERRIIPAPATDPRLLRLSISSRMRVLCFFLTTNVILLQHSGHAVV